MAIQQIQKSSTFKPDMIGDLVEVIAYDQNTGDLHTVVGVLTAYNTDPDGTSFQLDGVAKANSTPAEGYTLTITHYEFILDLTSAEDDQ